MTGGANDRLNIVGCELGRLLILATLNSTSRRSQRRFEVECSCGRAFFISAKRLMQGETMCTSCRNAFAYKYGVDPESEAVTNEVLSGAIGERDDACRLTS